VTGARRRELARTGALAVDMESAYVAESVRPLAVLRVVFDTGRRPLRALAAGPQAYRTLRRACALAASHLEQ
jgi:4-hydroxy-3-methylbut-2-enyl diphosphate reductase